MHFIVLGVLVSLGIFILITRTADLAVIETKGVQQLDFLNNVYLKAETNLLFIDQNAKEAGWKAVNSLLEEPGSGKCGYTTDNFLGISQKVNLLNDKGDWCLLNTRNEFSQLVKENLKVSVPQSNFSKIQTVGEDLIAEGTKNELKNEENKHSQSYVYDTSFRVPIGYNLEEFENVLASAKYLVEECRNYEELDKCINDNFETYFSNNLCNFNEIMSEERKRIICVASPNNYSIYTEQKARYSVEYQLALDFTPTEALVPAVALETSDETGVLVTFNQEINAESYGLYYTDYSILDGQTGPIQDVFSTVPVVLGYTTQTFWINNWQESCSFTDYNQAYLCGEKIVYRFKETDLDAIGNSYLFFITSLSNGVESDILETFLIE